MEATLKSLKNKYFFFVNLAIKKNNFKINWKKTQYWEIVYKNIKQKFKQN